jgi:hypothetical protein
MTFRQIFLGIVFFLSSMAAGAARAQSQACCTARGDAARDVTETNETRTHHVLTDETGKKIGDATRVLRTSLAIDREYLLYRAVDGDQLVLEEVMSYMTQSTENAIRNIKGDARVAVRYKLPFTGKTRDEIFAEARRNPELWSTNPEQAEIITNGGSFRITDDEFNSPAGLKKRLRQVVPFDLLETIERATSTVLATEFATIVRLQIVDLLVYRSQCAGQAPAVAQSIPDCDFDRQFGFPCSEKQAARVKKARQDAAVMAY